MGASSSRRSTPDRQAYPGPNPQNAQNVQCPRCNGYVVPPPGTTVFRCPCGLVLTIDQNQATMTLDQARAQYHTQPTRPPVMPPPYRNPGRQVMFSCRCPNCRAMLCVRGDAQYLVCNCGQRLALQRAPHLMLFNPDGTLNVELLEEMADQLHVMENGASNELIDMLPTHKFVASSMHSSEEETHKKCLVCLTEYEDGEELRTLPCFHYFHKDCVDPWLKRNRVCPCCKTPIDQYGNGPSET
eukprot:Rmarinus@m.14247